MNFKEATEKEEAEEERFRTSRVQDVKGSGGQAFTSPAGVYHEVATVAESAGCPEQRACFDEGSRLVHRQLCPHLPQPARDCGL